MSDVTFIHLNPDWNAEPNAPDSRVRVVGDKVELSFDLNPWAYTAEEGERATLLFSVVSKWRLGSTNDEGWYRGQCRYSSIAPAWGEFYELTGNDALRDRPYDWHFINRPSEDSRHFLFYLRDNTFECLAKEWSLRR